MTFDTPDKIYKQLFVDLHLSGIWPDGKMIADAVAKLPPEEIVQAYAAEKSQSGFDLKYFFEQHFTVHDPAASTFQSDPNKSEQEHLQSLWDVLSRPADNLVKGSSLIPLPYPYVVPGGRFNEIYYWDSYFTMLGLRLHQRWDLIENMIRNFAWLIDNIGFIPNGNRTYFQGRSQPPFFALMVDLLARQKGDDLLVEYLPILLKEYQFWMSGADRLTADNPATEHVVQLDNGILNRYYDHFESPRQEMYRDDVELMEKSGRSAKELYLDIRAACESGWDFSARWFADQQTLSTINTSAIIPVDLNCLLFNLEMTISRASDLAGQSDQSDRFFERANQRKQLLLDTCWNPATSYFHDYQFIDRQHTPVISLAGVFPLSFGLATSSQAAACAAVIEQQLLAEGGVVSTTLNSGQQWDAPNGWAPLQWMTVTGLDKYGFKGLALEIARRWTSLNEKVYRQTGKFVEKYNVQDLSLEAGGGEYPVQDGFGWSNGVYLALIDYILNHER